VLFYFWGLTCIKNYIGLRVGLALINVSGFVSGLRVNGLWGPRKKLLAFGRAFGLEIRHLQPSTMSSYKKLAFWKQKLTMEVRSPKLWRF